MTLLNLAMERLRMRHVRQERIVLPLAALLVVALVLVPLIFLVLVSLAPAGVLHFSFATYSLDNYWTILNDPATYRVLKNTLVYAGGSVIEALAIAFALAWIGERSDIRGAGWIRTAMFVLLALPTLALAFGWIMLLNPGNGAINVMVRELLGTQQGPFDIYTMTLMIFISGLMLAPTGYVMLCGLLRNMDPQLENAAQVAGSHRLTVLRRVTLPLVAPGILSVGIYTTMLMVQVFDTPLVIGLTAGVPVLSTRIYALSSPEGEVPNYGLAAAFGVFLLALALLLMWGYFRAVRVGDKFRVVTGRGFRPRKVRLGRWRYVAIGFVGIYFALMALPLLILLWLSLLRFYEVPSVQAMEQLSFANYFAVLDMSMVKQAVGNTVVVAFCTATIAMVLASVISWYSVRRPTRWSRWLDALAFTPMAIPGIVMAVAVLLAYIRTPLYGTVWIIVLAQVTVALPFGTRMMNGALIQVHKELEHAAATSGADWLTSLRTILFPLLLPHFLNGWLWVVAQSTRDLTIPFLLQTTDNMMISPALLQLWNTPDYPGASALAILMIFALMAVVIPVQIFAARRAGAW
jgi:iron(III) transport system permease protein